MMCVRRSARRACKASPSPKSVAFGGNAGTRKSLAVEDSLVDQVIEANIEAAQAGKPLLRDF